MFDGVDPLSSDDRASDRALRASEARYRALATASADVLYRMSADWSEMRELDGRGFLADTSQTSADWLARYIHPDDQTHVLAAIATAVETKTVFDYEHRVIQADGSLGWTHSRAVPLLDEDGSIREWIGAASNVTARKNAELAVQAQERQYHTIFTSIDEGYALYELLVDEAGEPLDVLIHQVNPAYETLTHRPHAAGRRLSEFAPIWDVEWGDAMVEVVRSEQPQRIERYNRGIERWFDVYLFPDPEAGPTRFGMVLSDITERRAMVDALRASEAKYRALFESMGQGYAEYVLVRDADGRAVDQDYLAFNPAFERIFGIPVEWAVGRRASEVFPGLESEWHAVADRVAQSGVPERIELEVSAIGRWYEAWVYPRGGDRLTALFEDITERKQAERALQSSEERQAFLLELADALRPIADPIAIQVEATRVLGRHLGAARVMYSEVEADDAHFVVHRDYTDGVPSLAGRHLLDAFGPEFIREHRAGRTLVMSDVARDERVGEPRLAAFSATRIGAFVGVPLVKVGRLAASFSVHFPEPHAWSPAEVALVEETAERTWAAVERAKTEVSLSASEQRYRSLFETIDEGYALYELLFDDEGVAVDAVIHQVNPAYELLTQRPNPTGQRLTEVSLGFDPAWAEAMAAVVRSGAPKRVERYNADIDRWFEVYIHPAPNAAEGWLALVFTDITERRQMIEVLRRSEERLRAIVEQTTDYAIFTTDTHGLIEDWFPGAEAVFGWTLDEIVGAYFGQTYTPEDQAAGVPERELREARTEGSTLNVRWHRHANGGRVYIEGVARGRFDAEGTFLGVLKIGRDATARRMAELMEGELVEQTRMELEGRIAVATDELRMLSRRLITVQEEERRFLARELHDEIGQVLTGLGLTLGSESENDSLQLHHARTIVAELTDQVRQLSVELRPAVLDAYGLLAAVRWLLDRLHTRSGLQVELQASALNQRFDGAIEIAAFRIVQEALTNVARHSGVLDATVVLEADAEQLVIEIHDAGKGFDPRRGVNGSGLGGIRERVELLGGTLSVTSIPGDGTTLMVTIPLGDESMDGRADQAARGE